MESADTTMSPAATMAEGSTIRLAFRDFSMLIALLAIWAFFFWMSPAFLSPRNLSNLAVELSITAVLALGMLLIILPGEIDLSIGSGVGLFGGVAAVLIFNQNWPAWQAMGLAMVLAVLVWVGMGALIVKQNVPSFIITLAGLLVFRGLQWLVISNSTIPVQVGDRANLCSMLTTWFVPPVVGYGLVGLVLAIVVAGTGTSRRRRRKYGCAVEPAEAAFLKIFLAGQVLLLFVLVCNEYRGLPLSAVILGVTAAIVWLITQHTPFGRYLYAIGGNEEAAFISGIPVDRVVIAAFGIMGLLVALGGFMQTAYAGASTPTIGELQELDAIAACVIGGTSLKGGRGTVVGVLFGALIMASLLNGMTLLGVTPELKYIARGGVLALAVWMDVRLNRQGR